MTKICIFTIIFILSVSCNNFDDEETSDLVVFSAISFSEILLNTKEYFEEKENVNLSFSFSGSQVLASQISNGAPVDIFISSGVSPVRYLLDKNLLIEEHIYNVTTNKLVLATLKDYPVSDIDDLRYLYKFDSIAIADPEYAPAGIYTEQVLARLKLEDAQMPKILTASNAMLALNYLETGNVSAAILYETDAINSDKVIPLDIIPETFYGPIKYPAVILNSTDELDLAYKNIDYLLSSEFTDILNSYGFKR